MQVNYHKWLECEVTNSYFKNGESSIFDLMPFRQSAGQMSNYSVLLNQTRSSFSLFVGINDNAGLDIESQFEGITELYFQLVVKDHLFFNYTNMNMNSEDEIYLFSNADASGNGQKLHDGEFASEEEKIKLRQTVFNYMIPDGEVKLEIKTEDGTVVAENQYSNSGDTNLLLDLQNQELGVYELWLNDQKKERFFLIDQTLEPACVGVVRINMQSMIDNYEEGMKYSIDFDARSAFRSYKVIVPTSKTIHEIKITGMEGEIYPDPVEEDFMGDKKALVFTSDTALPFRQILDKNPVLKITYASQFTDEDKITLDLPNPSVESISTKTNEQNEVSFYSTSIIYV